MVSHTLSLSTHEPSSKSVLCIDNLLSPEEPPGPGSRSALKKFKEKRKRATPEQLAVLNKVFRQTSFPSTEVRAQLGEQLDMKPRTVQIWFQNRRQALRTRARAMQQHMQLLPELHCPASPLSPPSSPAAPALPRLCCVLDSACVACPEADSPRVSPVSSLPSPASATPLSRVDGCCWPFQ